VLTMYQEEARAKASRRGVSPVASVRD
jgi:hypothetical protein